RVGELLAAATNLPDSFIGFGPDVLEVCQQGAFDRPGSLVLGEATAARLIKRIRELAVDVELQLSVRGISDADRLGVFISAKPRHFPFRYPAFAGNGIHDLKLVGTAGDRTDEPIPPGACLIVISRPHQCEQSEGGIANPAEAVIPVSGAADLLRQRSGRGRDDAAAWPEYQGF